MANKEALRKWVGALRSGKYLQAMGMLKERIGDEVRYCCLGVACDISNLGSWNGVNNYTAGNDQRMGSLPDPIREFYDVGTDDMVRVSRESVVSVLGQEFWNELEKKFFMSSGFANLANLNDAGASFSDIADVIEEEFGPLD